MPDPFDLEDLREWASRKPSRLRPPFKRGELVEVTVRQELHALGHVFQCYWHDEIPCVRGAGWHNIDVILCGETRPKYFDAAWVTRPTDVVSKLARLG